MSWPSRCAGVTSARAPGDSCSTISPIWPTRGRVEAHPPISSRRLAEAYTAFFAEASRPGFGDPPPGEWTAEQVVAHIAVNDDLMAAVCRGLIHDAAPRFDNAVPNDRAVLQALVEAAADLPSLVELGRARAETLRLLLARLDESQLATPVPCHLIDGDRVMVDQPLPWGSLAVVTQATYHLPLLRHGQHFDGVDSNRRLGLRHGSPGPSSTTQNHDAIVA